MCSHFSSPAYEWEYAVFHFLFLCQFAENDVLQIQPCPYKWHKLIISDCCIIFHGEYVLHFPNPVYHQWAFGLVPGLCYCKQCCNEHSCACVLIVKWFVFLWVYISNGITGSNGRSLKNHNTVFHNGWTNLLSHQQYKSIPIYLQPHQHLLFLNFLITAILTGVR